MSENGPDSHDLGLAKDRTATEPKKLNRKQFLAGSLVTAFSFGLMKNTLWPDRNAHTQSSLHVSDPTAVEQQQPYLTDEALANTKSASPNPSSETMSPYSVEQQKLITETATHLTKIYSEIMPERYYPTEQDKTDFFVSLTALGIELDPNNQNLGNQLAAVLFWESGFSPVRVSENGSKGIGLIQFTGEVPKNLNTTSEDLANMSPIKQLYYVKKFLLSQQESFGGDFTSLESLYTKIIAPQKAADSSESELYPAGSDEANRNIVLDKNKDGILRKGEASEIVRDNAVKQGENPLFL